MAKEVDLTSDSLDEYITTISGGHLNYLKQRLAHHLLKSQDLSAEIHHHPGQSAKLVLSFEKRERMYIILLYIFFRDSLLPG